MRTLNGEDPTPYNTPSRVSRTLAALTLLCLMVCLTGGYARAQGNDKPVLRIETGMHTAGIQRLDVDAKGRYLVTASMDKTARVWDAANGALLSTLRPPIGPGAQGMLFAVALSPDGRTVACGGATGPDNGPYNLYLFDRATGQMIRRVSGLPAILTHLAFSPDGRFLLAAMAQGGIRVIRVADGKQTAQDAGYGAACYGAAWTPGTPFRVVTTCLDGFLRLYDVGGDGGLRLRGRSKAAGSGHPYGVAYSPDGGKIAVGSADSTQVAVVAGQDLKPQYTPDSPTIRGAALPAVCWSVDGHSLYGGGTIVAVTNSDTDSGKFAVRRWADGGRGQSTDIGVSLGATVDLKARRAGGVFYASAEPALGALDGDGRHLFAHGPNAAQAFFNTPAIATAANLTGAGLLLSHDGGTVGFAYEALGNSPAVFSATTGALTLGKGVGLSAPLTTAIGLDIQNWAGTASPTLNGQPLALAQGEVADSLAIAPDRQHFLLGTVAFLRCYNQAGQEQWKIPVTGATSLVNISSDGQIGVAEFGDGTFHWYRMSDGHELLTFFPHSDQKRWVLWTPSGYYDASAGSEGLIGWQVGRGPDHAADFFSVSRFRDAYYRPAVTGRILSTADEAMAVKMAAGVQGGRPPAPTGGVDAVLPPVVTITSPENGSDVSASSVTLHYTVRTPNGQPVTALKVLVNGRPVKTTRDLQIVSADGSEQTVTVPIPSQDCQISLLAVNKQATSEPATVGLTWAGAAAAGGTEGFTIKPKLYVLAVGVSHYQDQNLTLQYSAKDAQDFAAVMLAQKGRLYADVQERVLVDAKATKDNILDGLDWIEKQTTQHDVAMVFLSGHGANDRDGNYLYIPVNFDLNRVKTTGVSFEDIKETVTSLPGKALFFVDTCHSGNVLGTAGSRDLQIVPSDEAVNELSSAENGAVVFTASTGRQVALEDKAWGNGAFTKAVLEGLRGKAAYNHDGKVTVNMLDLYVSDRVKVLTKGEQTPTTAKPQTVPDFPIAVAALTASR